MIQLTAHLSMCMVTRYTNCFLLRDNQIIEDDLWVADGIILDPKYHFWQSYRLPDTVINCQGKIIVPGFIETQINGGFGVDFSSNIQDLEKGLAMFRKEVTKYGVTGFCPTVITSTSETYKEALPKLYKQQGSGGEGAGVLGAHIEGPFINKSKKGAHPERFIQSVLFKDPEDFINFFGSGLKNVSIMTLAPELPNAPQAIAYLTKNNIICSLGHSTANITEAETGVNHGARYITHLFNAMMPFHHRDPGIVGLLSSVKINHKVYYGIIADGIHTHPASLRIAHCTNPYSAVIVTDAMAAMGLGDGCHRIGAQDVTVTGRKAVITGTDTLAGSVATMDSCIQHYKKHSRCSLVDAINCATKHPAELLKCTDLYGTLDFGSAADFVLIDEGINVYATFIGGECAFNKFGSDSFVEVVQ